MASRPPVSSISHPVSGLKRRTSTDWQELMCCQVRAWKSQAVVGRDPDQLACRSQATRKWPSNHTPAFATPGLLGSGYRKAWISEPKHTGRGKVAREVFGRVRTSEASAKQQRDSQPFHAACSRLRCCYSLGTRAGCFRGSGAFPEHTAQLWH